MATVPTTLTAAVGAKIPASTWNTYERDALSFLLDPPRLRVYRSADLSVSTSTWTQVTFDSESWDNDAMHSTSSNTARLIAVTAGRYLITVNAYFAGNATGTRILNLTANGAGTVSSSAGPLTNGAYAAANNTNQLCSATVEWSASANDYVELFVWQSSGGSLNLIGGANYTSVSMRRVSA